MLPCAEFGRAAAAARARGGLQLEPEIALPVQEKIGGTRSTAEEAGSEMSGIAVPVTAPVVRQDYQ